MKRRKRKIGIRLWNRRVVIISSTTTMITKVKSPLRDERLHRPWATTTTTAATNFKSRWQERTENLGARRQVSFYRQFSFPLMAALTLLLPDCSVGSAAAAAANSGSIANVGSSNGQNHAHSHSDSGLSSLSGRTSTMSPVSTMSTVSSVSSASSSGSSRCAKSSRC